MASAAFSVNGTAYSQRVAVAGGSTVTLALLSTTGVGQVSWSVVSNSSPDLTNPTITPTGSPSGAEAEFTMPAGDNQGYVIQCVINNGVDENRAAVEAYTALGIVGVVGARGIIPFCYGEKQARHPTYGWGIDINAAMGLLDPVLTGSDTATTTDATPTDTLTFETGLNGNYLAVVIFQAQTSGGTATDIITITPFKRVADTLTRRSAPTTTFSDDDIGSTLAVDVDVDGDNIVATVTGVAATTINWSVTGQVSYLHT